MRVLKSWNAKASFYFIANAGLLTGASGRDVHVQAIAGWQYRGWFAGVGAGLDYYFVRSVPLFIDIRKTFSKPHIPFIYADAGCNLPWTTTKDEPVWFAQHYKWGMYYDVGAGWDFKMGDKKRFLLSSGFSGKKLAALQTTGNDKTKISYTLRRLSLKVGIRL